MSKPRKLEGMAEEPFKGDQKHGTSVLMRWENAFRAKWVPRLPLWLETWHLTYLTLLWSGLILLSGWLAREALHWLWLTSAMVVAQYLSDLFDGAVGRHRNTGLIKWGYYMDHFLDYVFQSSIVIAYMLIAPGGLSGYFVAILVLSSAFKAAVCSKTAELGSIPRRSRKLIDFYLSIFFKPYADHEYVLEYS